MGDREGGIVSFDLRQSHGGHTAVLALFRHDAGRPELHPRGAGPPLTGARSSLHHLALVVGPDEQAAVTARYERQGLAHTAQDFDWIGWRGIFASDPEGNTVELVAKVREPVR